MNINLASKSRPTNDQPASTDKLEMGDYAFICMMAFINIPNILEVWGIDTIFKPYRMLALVIACFCVPRFLRLDWFGRQLAYPVIFAISFTTLMLFLLGGLDSWISELPFIGTIVFLFISTFALNSRKAIYFSLYASAVSFLISAYFGILAFNDGQYRLSGLFENPNTFGYAGCFVIIFAVNRYFPIPKMVRFFLGLCALPAMLLTGSRGTILALLGGYFSQVWRNPKLTFGTAIFLGCLMIGATLFKSTISEYASRSVFDRLTDREVVEKGGESRLAMMLSGVQVAAEHGFIGIGFGQYREKHFARMFHDVGSDGQVNKLEIHNFYATILCEWGVVGVYCFAAVFIRLVRFSRFLPSVRDWVIGFLGVTLANGLGSSLVSEVHFWVMLGISIQLVRLGRLEMQRSLPRSENSLKKFAIS
jgi:O-Antigen ligase